MNKKKMVAILAAATMLLGTVPVSAATTVSGTATGTGSATGTGDITAVDTTPVYEVTLPTGNVLGFAIDPYGLSDLAEGSTQAIDIATKGTTDIKVASTSGALIKNTSSVPMTVGVEFTITNVATGAATFVATDAGLADIENPAIYLTMVPTAATTGAVKDVITGAALATGAAVPILDGTEVAFYLEEAKYTAKKVANNQLKWELDTSVDDNYKAEIFQLAGKVNKVAGWEAYNETGASLAVTAVFTFNEYTGTTAPTIVTGTNALIAGGAGVAKVPASVIVADGNFGFGTLEEDGSMGTFDEFTSVTATVNGKAVTATPSNGYVLIAGVDVVNVGEETGPWTFDFVINGVTYTATYTAE